MPSEYSIEVDLPLITDFEEHPCLEKYREKLVSGLPIFDLTNR
jgi:hypothetical protein